MKKRAPLLWAGSLLLLCFSCYYDELPEVVIPEVPDDEAISFEADIEPLFAIGGRDCTQCHNGSTNPDLRAGNAYNALVPALVVPGDAEASRFYQRIPGRGHPFDVGFSYTTEEIALIKAWIDRGAENN